MFDLREDFLPYDTHVFDHVIAVGIFHFFKDLEMFFRESYRILKEDGTFSFTVKDSETETSIAFDEGYEILFYGHYDEYIEELIQKYNFKLLKKLRFLTY